MVKRKKKSVKGYLLNSSKYKVKQVRNELAVLVFFSAGYLSLRMFSGSLLYDSLGILFFISALYGVVTISKNSDFVF